MLPDGSGEVGRTADLWLSCRWEWGSVAAAGMRFGISQPCLEPQPWKWSVSHFPSWVGVVLLLADENWRLQLCPCVKLTVDTGSHLQALWDGGPQTSLLLGFLHVRLYYSDLIEQSQPISHAASSPFSSYLLTSAMLTTLHLFPSLSVSVATQSVQDKRY